MRSQPILLFCAVLGRQLVCVADKGHEMHADHPKLLSLRQSLLSRVNPRGSNSTSAKPLYVHLHIPKCAGATVFATRGAFVGASRDCGLRSCCAPEAKVLDSFLRAWNGQCDWISYEMAMDVPRIILPPTARLITFLRNPEALLISTIGHDMRKSRAASATEWLAQRLRGYRPEESLFLSGGRQAHYLCGGGGGPWPSIPLPARINITRLASCAIASLHSNFFFVGLVEELDASLHYLAVATGAGSFTNKTTPDKHRNYANRFSSGVAIKDELEQHGGIPDSWIGADRLLYAAAEKKFFEATAMPVMPRARG
jgi:hypothetical protein